MSTDKTPWQITPGVGFGPLTLGMTRGLAEATLNASQVEFEGDDEEPNYLELVDPWVELSFDGPHGELSQILVIDDVFLIGDEPLAERRLDSVLTALGARSFSDTRWTHPTLNFVDNEDSTKALLQRGTLWILSMGLGLKMASGAVDEITLRWPNDAPSSPLGSLTPEQLEFATTYVPEEPPAPSTAATPLVRWLSRLAGLVFLVALSYQLYRGYQQEMHWKGALPIEGAVVEKLGPDPTFADAYVIGYSPPEGGAYQVTMKHQYVTGLLDIGDKVELIYRPESPADAATPTFAQSVGFLEHIPAMFAMAAAYALTLGVISRVFG